MSVIEKRITMPTKKELVFFQAATKLDEFSDTSVYKNQAQIMYEALPAPSVRDCLWKFMHIPPSLWKSLSLYNSVVPTHKCADGVYLYDLETFADEYPSLARTYIFEHAERTWDTRKLFALVEGYWNRAAVLFVSRDTQHEKVIDIPSLLGGYTGELMLDKLVVIIEPGARVIIQDGIDALCVSSSVFVRSVDYHIGEHAHVTVFHNQSWIQQVYEFSRYSFFCDTQSELYFFTITTGTEHTSLWIDAVMQGRGARATVRGACALTGNNSMTVSTLQQHNARDTYTDLAIKSGLGETARAVYQGNIFIDKHAHSVQALQQNKNMLMGAGARVQSVPGLEVLNNDVQCSHGSAIGQLDAQQLFYAQSRGLSLDKARFMLLHAFFSDILSDIPGGLNVETIRNRLVKHVCSEQNS